MLLPAADFCWMPPTLRMRWRHAEAADDREVVTCDGARQQGLAGARGPAQQHAAGDAGATGAEQLRLREEVHHLLQLNLPWGNNPTEVNQIVHSKVRCDKLTRLASNSCGRVETSCSSTCRNLLTGIHEAE